MTPCWPRSKRRLLNASAADAHQADGAVLVAHRELALRALRHKINFARGQIGDVGLFAAAQAVALLRLLPAALQGEPVRLAEDREIDLKIIGPGQAEAQFFRVAADFVVIDGQAGAQNDVVQAVQRRAAKTVLFGKGRQRRGGRKSGDAENDVVVRINVPFQTDFAARRDRRPRRANRDCCRR